METATDNSNIGQNDSHQKLGHGSVNRKPFFVTIFLMLCALTLTSFWIANSHLMETPANGWAAMMAVSAAKAMLVILFFMHLWWERRWKYALTLPAMILGVVLVLLLVPDIGHRTDTYSSTRRSAAPVVVEMEAAQAQSGSQRKPLALPH